MNAKKRKKIGQINTIWFMTPKIKLKPRKREQFYYFYLKYPKKHLNPLSLLIMKPGEFMGLSVLPLYI